MDMKIKAGIARSGKIYRTLEKANRQKLCLNLSNAREKYLSLQKPPAT